VPSAPTIQILFDIWHTINAANSLTYLTRSEVQAIQARRAGTAGIDSIRWRHRHFSFKKPRHRHRPF